MSQEIWWAGTMLHIICLSLFFLLWEKFCHSCLLECSTKISCLREIHCPVKCLWDSDSHLCSLTWAHSPWETVWWDINRLESEALFLFCSFSSFISFSGLGLGWVRTALWGSSACTLLQHSHSWVPILPALPSPWELPGQPGEVSAGMGTKAHLYLPADWWPHCRYQGLVSALLFRQWFSVFFL